MSSLSAPLAPPEFAAADFFDRREQRSESSAPGQERRQFANGHDDLSPDAAELARAIDQYKLLHRRRFINFEEMLGIVKALGYSK